MPDKQTEKYVKYGGYRELKKEDLIEADVWGIEKLIREAYKKAIQENIKANTVILNKTFAKTNGFTFAFMGNAMTLPPMICGLEVRVSDELPNGCDFAVCEAPQTERERLIAKTTQKAVSDIIFDVDNMVLKFFQENSYHYQLDEAWTKIRKKYIGE